MYYRGNNNEIIETYKNRDAKDGGDSCGNTPTWLIVLLVAILIAVIGLVIYFKFLKKN